VCGSGVFVSVCVIGVVAVRTRGADSSALPCSFVSVCGSGVFVSVYVLGVFVSVCVIGVVA